MVGVRLALDVDEGARAIRELRVELLRIDAESLAGGQRHGPRILDPARVRVDRRRLLADRERLADAVEDRAAPGGDDDRLAVLAQRHPLERGGLHSLQPDRPGERAGEDEREEDEEQADAAVGDPLAHLAS